MARPRQSTPLQLGAGQAEYVLNHLLANRGIGRAEVRGALDAMGREIKVARTAARVAPRWRSGIWRCTKVSVSCRTGLVMPSSITHRTSNGRDAASK